jgi:hypothetical protein
MKRPVEVLVCASKRTQRPSITETDPLDLYRWSRSLEHKTVAFHQQFA